MIRREKIKKAAILLSTGMLTMVPNSITAFADDDTAWQYRASQIMEYLQTPQMQKGQVEAENNKIQYDSRPAAIADSNTSSVIHTNGSTTTSNTVRYASSTTTSGPVNRSASTEAQSGPGVQTQGNIDVQTSALTETYHEDFEVYSESLGGYFFFYSNIGNNGITDQPVYVDLPQNVAFTVQKDGVDIPYVSKQLLSDYGTYMFKIIAVKQPDVFDQNPVCYMATFNFRIQERPVKPTEPETQPETQAAVSSNMTNNNTSSSYSYYGQNYQSDMYASGNTSSSSAASGQSTITYETIPWSAMESASAAETTSAADESAASSEGDPIQANTIFSVGDDAAANIENEERERRKALVTHRADDPEQTYDTMTGRYTITYGEMQSMTTSVPNGILTNNSVSIDKTGLGAYADQVSVFRNGVPYSWPETDVFEEAGSYVIVLPLANKTRTFGFRILGNAETEISEYTVPENLELTEVTLDGAVKPVSSYIDGNDVTRLHIEEEGLWQLTFLSDEGRNYYATILIDHTPPEFSVSVLDGKATFYYDVNDVTSVVLNDGTSDTTYETLTEWTRPGRYTATAYDQAGNSTQVSFVLKKKINPAGFIAAGLAAVLAAVGIWYFKRTKENMDVK